MAKQNVLITGTSSGIGASFAVFLAEKDYHVILTARREEKLRDIHQLIISRGGTASIFVSDLSDEASRINLFNEITQSVGQVDMLINNAGFGWYGYYTDMPWPLAREIEEVNIRAVTHLTSLFLPAMRKREDGHIINIGSISGGLPNQGIAMYSATKAFLDAFTTALYRELHGSGVSASVMRLGPVQTEFYNAARRRENGRSIPAERFAIPTARVNQALWRLIRKPRRVIYVPAWMAGSKYLEILFAPIIDLLGPLLLKRRND